MKIFLCDNRLGGLLGFRIDVIKHFVSAGHEVTLVAPPAVSEWDNVGEEVPKGVRVITINMQPEGMNPFKELRLYQQYLNLYKKERPDIVFNYTIKPNIYSTLAAKRCGCRVVCMLAGLGYMFDGKSLFKSMGLELYKYALNKAEKVLVLNQMNYDKVLEKRIVPSSKLHLLKGGEGVNLKNYPHVPANYENGTVFLMVSRVLVQKGYMEFAEAASQLNGMYHNVSFEILGPLAYDSPMGVDKEQFERDIAKGFLKYLGVTKNVNSKVGRKNVVVVLPSYYGEGLNRSLMEACAIGRPIITTNISGCRECVEDGRNGFLVEKQNTQSLVEAMKRFINLSEQEKAEMAERSHELAVSRFNVADVISTYDALLRLNFH